MSNDDIFLNMINYMRSLGMTDDDIYKTVNSKAAMNMAANIGMLDPEQAAMDAAVSTGLINPRENDLIGTPKNLTGH